jgi:hypothetical protein
MTVKDMVRPLPGVRCLSLLRQRINFSGSRQFWEQRYERGGTSGEGSYGTLALGKAGVLNRFVADNGIETIIEFGCGDGNQLSLAAYPNYIGLDVSQTAIRLCGERFIGDRSKSFFLYDSSCFVDHANLFKADLALSLDVVYHLVEDSIFEAYMSHLFDSAERHVIIYATNNTTPNGAPHVRHRQFSSWIDNNCPAWQLEDVRTGPGSGPGRPDFFFYGRP